MTRRTALLDQPGLWDLEPEPTPTPPPAPAPAKKTRRFHVLDLPAPTRSACNPQCLTCGHDEGDGHCNPCAITCRRPLHHAPVEICLTTRRVTARPAGGRLVAVDCPYCSRTHWHSATATNPHRISSCGKPYIVHLAEAAQEAAA